MLARRVVPFAPFAFLVVFLSARTPERTLPRAMICPTAPISGPRLMLEDLGWVQWGVSVTPDGQRVTQLPNATVNASFTVKNTGTCPDTFNVTASKSGSITVQSFSPHQIPSLAAGASATVTVTYKTGLASPDSGVLTLTALGVLGSESDNGSYNVTIAPPHAVTVTRDGDTTATRRGNTGATFSQTFTVQNIGSSRDSYTITCSAATPITCTGTDSTQVTLNFLEQRVVTAFYTAGGGGTGRITLKASNAFASDTGWYSVPVAYPVDLVPDVAQRDLCVTIMAGPAAAYECGGLRLTHPLPSVRTLNTVRAPTLIYNSQLAHPYALVRADVTLPVPDALPDSVRMTLTVNGVNYVRGWPGNAWSAAGQTRRIVIGFDPLAQSLSTGVQSYTLEARRIVNGVSNTVLYTATGSLVIVDRSTSPFGAGWWLAGLERLFFTVPAGQVLWVGGDGSTRLYQRQTGTVGTDTAYVAPAVDRPDTLLHTSANQWIRRLPAAAKVTFNSGGFHISTTNRLGYSTTFTDSALVTHVHVPPDSGPTYTFFYSGTPTRLDSVSVPDSGAGTNRVTKLSKVGDSLRITDPGSPAVVFAYDPSQSNRIVSRRDRRSAVTAYTYDAGYRLAASRLALGGADSINRSFCAAEVRGLATCVPTLVPPESSYTIYDGPRTDSADITHFWADRFGVTQVRDPYGRIKSVTRGDHRWPALATRVQYPNAWVLGATYDARGHIATLTDSSMSANGQYATTSYTWDQTWDALTQITLPQGDLTTFAYDTLGNRSYQQDGRGQMSRVVFHYNQSGNGTGLVQSIVYPDLARDSIAYDVRGNLALTRSPLGWFVYTDNDRLGRPHVVRTQLDTNRTRYDSTFYDLRSRVVRTASVGPARSGVGQQTVTVRQFYNNESRLDSLQRWAVPDGATIDTVTTRWRYDLAERTVAEIAPDGAVDSTRYDPAGNAITVVPRRGAALAMTMVYDRMNRLVRRSTPQVTYARDSLGLARWPYFDTGCQCPKYYTYPFFALDPATGDTVIPADVATFVYDSMGNLVRAYNGDAFIRRTYFPNGLLNTDTLKILSYATRDSTKNTYGIQHRYDLDRRVTVIKHPHQLAPRIGQAIADSVRYVYDPAWGAIDSVIDPMGKQFAFAYDARGQRIRLALPGAVLDTVAYDQDGRWLTNWVKKGPGYNAAYPYGDSVFRRTDFTYVDGENVSRAANRFGYEDTTTSTYTGLGQLRQMSYVIPQFDPFGHPSRATSSDTSTFDPLGNMYGDTKNSSLLIEDVGTQRNPQTGQAMRYLSGNGRHRASAWTDASRGTYRQDTVLYDPSGNTRFSYQTMWIYAVGSLSGTLMEDRASYYGADGKLRASEYRQEQLGDQTITADHYDQKYIFEEYRYDALGRRVLVRTRRQMCPRSSQANLNVACRLSTVRRTVWDGMQELYEIQMPGGDTVAAATMDNDTLPPLLTPVALPVYFDPNPQFGRVAYTHGAGLDQPLSVTRINLRDWPWNDSTHVWTPLTIAPHWNWRSQADYGTFGDGSYKQCLVGTNRCVTVGWRASAFAYGFEPLADTITAWHGTVISGKEDGAGLLFRRNRYLDPQTGRFTQEDPLGLAGGLNLYAFGGGDPVNFSDPFGLAECRKNDWLCAIRKAGWQMLGSLGGFGGGAEIGATAGVLCGPGVEVCSPAGALIGGGLGALGGLLGGTAAFNAVEGSGNGSGSDGSAARRYKVPKSGQSAEEASKDIPSWAQGQRPFEGESGKDFAKRLLDEKYGAGNYETGPRSEFSQLQKYADRHFTDPQ